MWSWHPRASISVSGSSSSVVDVFLSVVVAWVPVETYVEFVEVGHVITPISIADPTPYHSASSPKDLLSFLSLWSDGQLYTTIPGFFAYLFFPAAAMFVVKFPYIAYSDSVFSYFFWQLYHIENHNRKLWMGLWGASLDPSRGSYQEQVG